MTEQKKTLITDALGEIEDRFVAEAVEYKKAGFTWKYTRELATLAACAAVLFFFVSAIRLIPIGPSGEVANGAPEMMQEAATIVENAVISKAPTTEAAPQEGNAERTPTNDITDIVENIENLTRPVGAEGMQEKYLSKGIEWEEITTAEKVTNDELCAYPTLESIQTSSLERWMSAEEILAMDVDIFMGTVVNMQTYHVTGGMEKYFTVATVEIGESIRGESTVGGICRIYLPYANVNGIMTTTSIIGDLDKLEVGSKAIFMPHKVTEEVGEGGGNVWLSYHDFSEYYFEEGMRFLFLETETGTSYESDVYEVPGGKEASLEDIAEYLRDKIAEE